MKKNLILALVASFILCFVGTAFAADIPNPLDIKFDGSLTLQYRNDNVKNVATPGSYNGMKILGVVNATKNIAEGLDLYTRFTYESISGGLDGSKGYGSALDYANRQYNGTIDAFGLKIASGTWNWTVGSQALTIGQGMVYDNGFIGKHALPYAIDGKGKLGAVTTEVTYAKTNYEAPYKNDTFYVIQLGYDVSPQFNVGGFYTKWNPGNPAINDGTYYGINTVYKFDGKTSFNAEFAKSNYNVDNKAYIAGLTYAFDKNDKVSASAYRSEDLSNIFDSNFGGMTTAPNANTKGYMFSYKHKMGTDTTLSVAYDTYDHINPAAITGTSNDRNRTKVGVTFVF